MLHNIEKGEVFLNKWHKHIIIKENIDSVVAQNNKNYLKKDITISDVDTCCFSKKEFYGAFDPLDIEFDLLEDAIMEASKFNEKNYDNHIWTIVNNENGKNSVLNSIRTVQAVGWLVSRVPWCDEDTTKREKGFIYIEGNLF